MSPIENTQAVAGEPTLQFEYVATAALQQNPQNPRKHSKRQVKQIAASMRATKGCVVPLVVDATGMIIAGHGRWQAAQLLGISKIPIVRIEGLSKNQIAALSLADNKLVENSTWDDELVAKVLKSLLEVDLDFDIEATGFTVAEIDMRIVGIDMLDDDARGDDIPKEGVPVSVPGDMWILDRHRVLCGNALDALAYSKVMNGEIAALVVTDPPYNVKIAKNVSGLGKVTHREFAMASGEMPEDEFITFLTKAFKNGADHSVPGSLHYAWMDWRHVLEIVTAGRAVFSKLMNICVWDKISAGMGSQYRSAHEFCFVFRQGSEPHRNNIELGRYGRNRSNIWRYPSPAHFGRGSKKEGDLLSLHPTVKSLNMIADIILDASAPNDIVLDYFLGSGTTVVAAEKTGRRCFGLELDPRYVDTVVRRWQGYTGKTAIHAVTGRSFNEIERANTDQAGPTKA